MLTDKEIGERIKRIRGKEYTQEELAEQLGIGDRAKISRIENGKQSMTANELIKFCSLLNISLDALINNEKINSKDFLTMSDRYLQNNNIEIEEKRDVIKKVYIKLANNEIESIPMCNNLNKINKNNEKSAKSAIEKYKISSTIVIGGEKKWIL